MNNKPKEAPIVAADNLHKGKKAFRIFFQVAVVILVVTLAYLFFTRHHVTTDNAQVDADIIPVAPRVGGQVLEVLVSDNQMVKKGDVIFKLDPADYQARFDQAQADLLVAQAQWQNAQAQEKILDSNAKGGYTSAVAMYDNSTAGASGADADVSSAVAAVDKAAAQQKNARLELERSQAIFAVGGISQSQLDNTQAAYDVAMANLNQAKASLEASKLRKQAAQSLVSSAKGKIMQSANVEEQLAAAKAQTNLAAAKVKSAEAALELATNQLQYTTVVASTDGLVSKLSVHPGQLISTSQTVAELVPGTSYLVANFKEVQIAKIQPGDKVKISVDAYPHHSYKGVVESVSGGTGARFSVLPADNASGNFVKVIQRVPVRIRWQDESDGRDMQAGLSAKVTVYANSSGS